MNDFYVEAFQNQIFNQVGNESAIFKIILYNPPDFIFQHLSIKENFKNIEVNRMRNGSIVDVSTSVNIQEVVKNGGRVIEIL